MTQKEKLKKLKEDFKSKQPEYVKESLYPFKENDTVKYHNREGIINIVPTYSDEYGFEVFFYPLKKDGTSSLKGMRVYETSSEGYSSYAHSLEKVED